MQAYYVPAGEGLASFVEKRSEFIGQLRPVDGEEQARAFIEAVKKKHHDARHNCWCYLLKDGPVRYSDDGEPQGTAGQPMLGVFQKAGVTNLCCVVTRYFGGVLLGAGGLVRAYTQAAKLALEGAGVAQVRRWMEVRVDCPYSFFERVKLEAAAHGGVLGEVGYTHQVQVGLLLPEEQVEDFRRRVVELSAGACRAVELGEKFRAGPPLDSM